MSPEREIQAYHALNILEGGEYRRLKSLREEHASWYAAWQARNGVDDLRLQNQWQKLEAAGVTVTLPHDPTFPGQLKEIPWPPFALYSRGTLGPGPFVAIVGTRKATPGGETIARDFARGLSRAGVTVVSGLAFGIDAAAHRGALEAGGRTVAVLATGVDRPSPREHAKLAEDILAHGGALLSEYSPGAPSFKQRFIERNRIVSGLSLGVVVIEAPVASGALATTRFALDQGRDVFVVPGPITHPNYHASHELIKAGAALVTSPDDVLIQLNITNDANSTGQGILIGLDDQESRIVKVLKDAGRSLSPDEIGAALELEASALNQSLGVLVVRNLVQEAGGRYYV